MKTILIPGYGVSIILIIGLNIPCINVLTCTHNLSIGKETRGSPTCSFEILIAFDMECEWHLFSMRIIDHSIFFINGS